jgi:hypothetical protein
MYARLASRITAITSLGALVVACAFATLDTQKGGIKAPDENLPNGIPTTSANKAIPGPIGKHAYNLHPLAQDVVFTNPANQWYYYFEIRSGLDLYPKESYFSLDYSTSQTLLAGQGSITVFLNGYPIASRVLPATSNDVMPWKVPLPDKYFKLGFNEIRVSNRQKSSAAPCSDVDNLANWLKLGKNTLLHLVRQDLTTFPLMSYPFPYLDPLEDNVVRCAWMVPTAPSTATISNMMDLASDWGKRLPDRGIKIQVASRAEGNPKGQDILITDDPKWVKGATPELSPTFGFLKNFSPTGQPGTSCLVVGGADGKGLHSAEGATTQQEMMAQMSGTAATLPIPPVTVDAAPTTRLGSFSFTDLGLPAVHLAGAFHQKTQITIRRPLRCDLGRESYIKLRFRHSASMNPLRSLISIYLNNIPIGSAKLEPENANDGVIRARIPAEELAKNFWVIDIACFHDLGAIDCAKSYDDVAWTVIEGESTFDLVTGDLIGRPYLESFPYLIPSTGQIPKSTDVAFSKDPSDEELSLAAVIAARAAQTNRIQLSWTSRTGDVATTSQSGIVIGYYSEVERFSKISNELLVCPVGPGKFKISNKLQLIPDTLVGGAIIQAVAAPKTNSGVIYVILAQDNDAMNVVNKILGEPGRADQIGGQACVITKDGRIIPLKLQGQDQASEVKKIQQTYTPQMKATMAIIVLILIAVCWWVGKQFVKKKPMTPEAFNHSDHAHNNEPTNPSN